MSIMLPPDFISGKIAVLLPLEYINEFVDACYEAGLEEADGEAKDWFYYAIKEGHDVVAYQKFGALDGSWYDAPRKKAWDLSHPDVIVLTWDQFLTETDLDDQDLEGILDLL